MNDVKDSIVKIIESLLEAADKADVPVTMDTLLHGDDGLGLDSLQTAELSATLEDELGSDPFSAGEMPETVGQIVAFYDSAA